jgi:glucose-6-phosphate isomerase
MERSRFAHRLLRKDPTLWKSEPDTAKLIRNRLGWLDCVREFRNRADEILKFASQVRHDGIRHTVLLGMGGSALCPEVCAQTFGSARGWPELLVLDNTDPAAVRYIESQIDLEKTLFVVPSKSGATLETLCFYRHFYELVGRRSQRPGHAFAAITDAGTWLAREAAAKRFRACFVNPPDIGGRYSALSFFGLTPMALLGLDIRMLLERALQFQISCGAGVPTELNPGIQLGTLLAHYYRHGRDKLTLVMAKNLSAFGYWVEQLVAESTGKEGLGIVPVVDEGLGPPTVYNDDRVFVYVSHGAAREPRIERRLVALEKAGHPTVRIQLPDRLGLGEEFFRWELAVATAGAILGVNPFDEPDLLETRGNTLAVLNQWKRERSFPEEKPAAVTRELAVYAAEDIRKRRSAVTVFHQCLDTAQPGDYVAFLAYFRRGPARDKILQTLRRRLRDRCHVATTLAYGPRYLHSTGQLYKEGPDKGIFILLTADVHDDIPVPGQDFSFGVLQRAQALADLASLREKGRRVIHVHLQRDLKDALKKLLDCLSLAT